MVARGLRNNGILWNRRTNSVKVQDDMMAHNRRRGSTSITATYEMWVMPVATFISLTELRPHQEMVAERLVKQWDPSMRAVFFLSHQWTSFDHPDHTLDQIRTMKQLLLNMKRGEVGTIAPNAGDSVIYGKDCTINAKEWPAIVEDAFIWMDYFSIPQPGAIKPGDDAASVKADMKRAINSVSRITWTVRYAIWYAPFSCMCLR